MGFIQVFIGPFRRQYFAECLASLLNEEPGLVVTLLAEEADAQIHLGATSPTIVILESLEDQSPTKLLPCSDAVAVILISQERQDLQIALKQVDRNRLRAAIDLVAETPHPKIVALDTDSPVQPPFALPNYRQIGRSGLSWVIAWLDTAFACALDDFASRRGEASASAWMDDLNYLRNSFAHGRSISRAEEQAHLTAMMEAPMWQVRLFQTFALDPIELKLLCIAAAPEIDQRYAQAIGLMQSNYAEPRPNATTLAQLVGPDCVGADIVGLLAGRRHFARFAMIRHVSGDAPQPGYCVAPAIFDLMLGIRRHAGHAWRLQQQGLPAQPRLAERIAEILGNQGSPTIIFGGETGVASDEIAAAVIACKTPVLQANCEELEPHNAAVKVRNWALRARLHDAALMLCGLDSLPDLARREALSVDTQGLVRARLLPGVAVGPVRDAIFIDVGKSSRALQSERWQAAAEDHGVILSNDAAKSLGGTLRLRLPDIETVTRMAAGQRQAGASGSNDSLIRDAARVLAASHAPETVRRPACNFGWDDIVLPPKIKRTLQAIPEHVRHSTTVLDEWGFASRLPYGRGVGALFSGPSGTGKTMCAQVIASALGVELMQVEIARCVSKYIGETEKNIDNCFRAAEAASAVLLFDEADALFGKRTEIKDAHDRYANVEVAYLLQRIEAYEGLVILTSNMKANIDAAFLRRLRFVCDFPMPDANDRQRIWDLAIPNDANCAPDVSTEFLARRLPLSGGSIQAIAVNAAYGAAAEGYDELHMRHVMDATRSELIKNGMLSAEKSLAEQAAPLLQGAVS